MYQNVIEGKFLFFLMKYFQSRQYSTNWKLVFTFPIRILLKPRRLSIKKNTNSTRTVSRSKCTEESKKLRLTLQRKDVVSHSLGKTWITFSEALLAKNLQPCWQEEGFMNQNLLATLNAYTLMTYTDMIPYNIVGAEKTPLLRCFLFIPELKLRDFITTEQYT